jgi:hypothetical protein
LKGLKKISKYKYNDYHKEINGKEYKKCTLHNEYFPNDSEWFICSSDFFFVNKTNKTDGLYPYCKKCSSKKYMKWEKEHPEEYLAHNFRQNRRKEKIEARRKISQQRRENGYYDDYFELNPEKKKQYAENHRDHDITNAEWIANKNFFKNENGEWVCAYCGMTEKEHKTIRREQLHKEHVEHNGYNDVRNCVPACYTCNSSKWQYDMETWYREQTFFNEDNLAKIKLWCSNEYKKYIEDKPPYIIKRSRVNDDNGKYHYEYNLWTVDVMRNIVEIIYTGNKKKDMINYINNNKLEN